MVEKKVVTKISLTIFVVVVLGIQVFVLLYFNKNITNLRQEVNDTKNKLQEKINENYMLQQEQIDKLSSSLQRTEESLSEQMSQLKAKASADFSGIIESAIKSVVSIKTDVSLGSGFIISDEGYIVTNAHVLTNAHYARIFKYNNELENAIPIGIDLDADIALLKISSSDSFLKFGDSDELKVGEKVIAVGNPYGLSFSVTEGIISALDRKGLNNLPYYIQTDVALNPGNSGGPLINNEGKVIGINNFKVAGGESLGFALESNYAEQVINNIAEQILNKTII